MDRKERVDLFVERATAAACRVSRVADADAVARLVAEDRARPAADCGGVGVVHAVRGVASTGTCVVETDDEETRLLTMLPETSVIVLKASAIVDDLPDLAAYLRERQADGRISYTSFITGPSRTADIERVSAIGVHGPLALHVILVED
ncbi:MAG: lactate utilization protein C [Kiritimatiellia bacterium]